MQGSQGLEAAEQAQALGRAQTRALDRLQHEGVPALSLVYNLVACLRIMLAAEPAKNPGANPQPSPGPGAHPTGTSRQLCEWLARLLLTCTDPDSKPKASVSPAPSPERPLPHASAPAPSKPGKAAPPEGRKSGAGATGEPRAAAGKAGAPRASATPERAPDKRRSGRGSMIVVAPPAPADAPAPIGREAGAQNPGSNPVAKPDPPDVPAVAAVLEHFVGGDAAFAALRSANRASRARPSRAESRRASLFVAPHLNPGASPGAAPASPAAGPGAASPATSPAPASPESHQSGSPLLEFPLARAHSVLPPPPHINHITASAGPGRGQQMDGEGPAKNPVSHAGLDTSAQAQALKEEVFVAKGPAISLD